MKRRSFFGMLIGAICAPFLPKPKLPGLMWRKDAFEVAFDWPAIEAMQRAAPPFPGITPLESIESTSRGPELFVTSGGQGYIYRSEDVACSVEDFAKLCEPHFEAGQRQLADAIEQDYVKRYGHHG